MSKKSNFKRILSAVLAVLICVPIASSAVVLADEPAESSTVNSMDSISSDGSSYITEDGIFVRQKTYSQYYEENKNAPTPLEEQPLTYTGCDADAQVSIGTYEGVDDAVIWENQYGTLNFDVDVKTAGNYNIEICYYPIIGGNTTTEVSVLLDGTSPYETATRIELPRVWASAYPITADSKDNEVRPPQVEVPKWVTTPLKDVDGLFNDPLIFNLDAGKHTISLYSEKAAFAIAYIKLKNTESYPAYTKPTDSELSQNAGTEVIKIQGENYLRTNSQTIFPTYNRGDYKTEPSHPVKQRYNTVGEATWDSAGQTITWEMNVANDGYYKVGIKARQKELRGMYTNRRLYIDGSVPNEEMSSIKFYYDADWVTVVPEDDNGDPVYVYLTKGKHELSLEVIPGEIGDSMRRLDDIVYEANQLYMQILMITGPTPDKYTDYYVHRELPELLDSFTRLANELRDVQDNIESLSKQNGSEAAVLGRLADVLDICVAKKDKIPAMVLNGNIKNNVAAVSSWMRKYRYQPLEIDFIELSPADKKFTSVKTNFFKSLSFNWKAFIGSFKEDYTVMSDMTKDSINVWVSLGRDQTNVIKQLTDSEFSTEYGIDVSINLVQGAIMEAVLAGKGPDAALFVGGEFPVNLAMRELVTPLNDMDGFDEVVSRFHENATVHYTYDNQVYGIPLQQTFPMMFYRKDMLASVGITEPPKTWDEFIDILPAIQRAYMQPGLILPANNGAGVSVAAATEPGHTFALLMLQSDTNYYNEDMSATNFDSKEAVDAFAKWTDFYNIYKFDQIYDAFTRFRTGEAPIVIQNYCTFYNQLTIAAPEIAGLWDFTSVPGTLREDGTISHAANSSGSGAIILKTCDNPEAAWEFIKWFTETDTMVSYGQNVEGVMGPLGRFESANVEALQKLNWSKKDLDKILTQMEELEEIPISPSAYVVTRDIMNAFRAVVNDKDNPRETLRWYNVDINNEITRKRQNLGIDK